MSARAPMPAPAWRSLAAWLTLAAWVVLGTAADLSSKAVAFRYVAQDPVRVSRAEVLSAARVDDLIPQHPPVVVVPDALHFTLKLNPGAVFGIGAGKRAVFIAFTVLAVGFALWMYSAWTTARDRWAHAGIGLLIAGGLGNLYDRLVFACVRDFIHPLPGVKLPLGVRWPNGSDEVWPYVSNVADLWLIVGIAILLIVSWSRPAERPASDAKGEGGDPGTSGG